MALSYGFALRHTDNSADFADALHAVTGDGVAEYGGRLAATVNGFSVTISTGFVFAAGRWLLNDELYRLTIPPPTNRGDRTDAIAARVDYGGRVMGLEVLSDIDAAAAREDPTIIRNDTEYCIVLYLVRVKRGATSLTPDDITDVRVDATLCGSVVPYSSVSGGINRAYQFIASGIDDEVQRLIEMSQALCDKADEDISDLDEALQKAGGTAEIGELLTCRKTPPDSVAWILCDGSDVPAEYPELSALLGGKLPALSAESDRYRTYIYGGAPALLGDENRRTGGMS